MSSVPFQIATSLAWGLPAVVVMIVGIVLAIGRWQRHATVSAFLVAGLATMLICWLAFHIAMPILVSSLSGTSVDSLILLLGVLGILMALVDTLSWGALVAAVLGWRSVPDGSPPAPLQFSIRGLIALTLAVALMCGLGRVMIGNVDEAALPLVQLVDDLPATVCLGIAIWIAVTRWQRHPAVSHLAIWAFALAIGVSILPQLLWMAGIELIGSSSLLFCLINIIFSIATATSWALTIAAALGWRDRPMLPGNAGEFPTNAGSTAYARHP
jgi:hypothetical protein